MKKDTDYTSESSLDDEQDDLQNVEFEDTELDKNFMESNLENSLQESISMEKTKEKISENLEKSFSNNPESADVHHLSDSADDGEGEEHQDLSAEKQSDFADPKMNEAVKISEESEEITLSNEEMKNMLKDVSLDELEMENQTQETQEEVTLSVEEMDNLMDNVGLDNMEMPAVKAADNDEIDLEMQTDSLDGLENSYKESSKKEETKATKKKISKQKKVVIDDKDLVEIFTYLDHLLDALPENKIREFAESKHYDRYISIINHLGIK